MGNNCLPYHGCSMGTSKYENTALYSTGHQILDQYGCYHTITYTTMGEWDMSFSHGIYAIWLPYTPSDESRKGYMGSTEGVYGIIYP